MKHWQEATSHLQEKMEIKPKSQGSETQVDTQKNS